MKSVQWAPSGVALEGVPSEIMRILATAEGKTFGYGYGPGWSMMFGSEHGDVKVEPGQWVTRHDDGTVTVSDTEPDPGPYVSTYPLGNKVADEDAEAAWNKRRRAILDRIEAAKPQSRDSQS